ncbi:MAG: DMT family transporter [Sphingomonas sp.]|nr:DMT family transporter [Sphingomonas sp.]
MSQTPAPATTSDVSQGRLAFAAVVVANVALAFGPWFVRAADTGPVAAAFWRISLAAPLLVGLAMASGWTPRQTPRGLWLTIAFGGVCFAADLASWHLGILRTTLANATLFGNSAVLFFPIYGFFAARALPSRLQTMALVLAAGGAALLLGQSYEAGAKHLVGDLLSLLAGILYTVYFIAMARARETMAPLPTLALSTLASALPLLVTALLLGERIMPGHWGPVIGLALASQVLGQGLMIFAIGRLSPLVMGIALLIQPIVGATIGWSIYGEQLGLADLTGAMMVAVALVLVRRAR